MDGYVLRSDALPVLAPNAVSTQPYAKSHVSQKAGIFQPGKQFFSGMPLNNEYPQLPRDINSRFGNRLRELRRAKNLTQLQMAVYFGIDRSFISDVECGKKSISLCFLEVIALGLNITVAEMLRGL
jgi:DNA-binding XRE family transcriptional regulator